MIMSCQLNGNISFTSDAILVNNGVRGPIPKLEEYLLQLHMKWFYDGIVRHSWSGKKTLATDKRCFKIRV